LASPLLNLFALYLFCSISFGFESCLNRIEQRLLPEGFVQKVHRAGFKGSHSRVVVCMGCDEDDWDSVIGRNQMTLKLEPIHARHPHIKNQARRIVQLIRLQERFRRRKTLHPKSHGPDQIVERIPKRIVIVYDRYEGSSGHAGYISFSSNDACSKDTVTLAGENVYYTFGKVATTLG
jgi:hypothetical protein